MLFEQVFTPEFVIASLSLLFRESPTILFASMGELITEKSGILNLGVEGLMLVGAFTSFTVAFFTGDIWLGAAAAILAAVAVGLLFAFLSINLRINQVVAGLAIWLFSLGLTAVLLLNYFFIPAKFPFGVPSIHTLDAVLLGQNVLVFVAFLLVPATSYFLSRTSLGLRIRAVGENPRAADSMGINVYRMRYIATLIGAASAGLAGAYFTIGLNGTFTTSGGGITRGLGFIAIAFIYFARWNPYRVLMPLFVYEFVISLSRQLQFVGLTRLYYFLDMFPYIAIVALIPLLGRRAIGPDALMQPYQKGG